VATVGLPLSDDELEYLDPTRQHLKFLTGYVKERDSEEEVCDRVVF
jgi:hypothetical protein